MVFLKKHLKKYPEMELSDIIKLHYQGILGPAHLYIDREKALNFMRAELVTVRPYDGDMVEEISDTFVRVYLYPYYKQFQSFELLATAFAKSAEEHGSKEDFVKAVRALITDENKKIIEHYLKKGPYPVSHSELYRVLYDPHYRVISKKYLNLALGKEQ